MMYVYIKDFKKNIADVLPVAKESARAGLRSISFIRVVARDGECIMQATSRYIMVNTVVGETDEEFELFVTPETLAAIKAYPHGNVEITPNFIAAGGARYLAEENTGFPAKSDELMAGTWEDEEYFTSNGEPVESYYPIHHVKHIKDVKIIPRFNKPMAPVRFKAKDRAYGVMMPSSSL